MASAGQTQFLGPLRADSSAEVTIASRITSIASCGCAALRVLVHDARQQRLIEAAPVHADAHRLAVAAGDLDQLRELLVAPGTFADVARIDAQLVQRFGARRIVGEQLVAVEMEIADQRHVRIHLSGAVRGSAAPPAPPPAY